MQDVHEILGAGVVTGDVGNGARIFGDRRLRAPPNGSLHHQSLKCPRCDSLNTKFCYYNNYNLSQPRHFCKNCRRYWTKGGVLRNVPVGGGCRKSKRSSRRKTSGSPHRSSKRRHKSDSRSSSESTAVGSGKAIGVATKASEVGTEFTSNPNFEFSEQPPATVAVTFNSIAMEPIPSCSGMNSNFEPLNDLQASAGVNLVDPDGSPMFTDIGGFVSLMDRDQHQNLLEFGNIETTPFGIHQNQVNNQLLLQNFGADRDWQKEKIDGVGDEWGQEIFDQTVNVDLLRNSRTGDGVLAGPDWHGVSGGGEAGAGGHLGMFDLTPGSDWSQSSQWHESDLHLYLPP